MSENNGDFAFPAEPPELKTAVGSQELIAREMLGNDRYEALVKFGEESAQATLDTDHAIANRLNAVAMFYQNIGGLLGLLFWLGAAWSIFFWVIWALH